MDTTATSPPQMCGYYSITSEREFDETASSLRYFKQPFNFPIDLNKGIDSIQEKSNAFFEEKLDSILTYIVRHKAEFVSADLKMGNALIPSTKYITYRGIIRRIMNSPYEKRSGWCVLATKYKNNIYLAQLTRPEDRNYYPNEWTKKFSYYGQKFEEYCLTDDPSKMPELSKPIDASTQFFCIFKRKLVGRNFLFAGEMDGIVSDKPVNLNESDELNNLRFISLKVAADPSKAKNGPKYFRLKCQNVWTQNFLTGVKNVYFGMRDNQGIVSKIQHIPTENLIRLDGQIDWDPSKCFQFLDDFLRMVEAKMGEIDCPNTVFEFNLNQIDLNITCTEHPGKSEFSLLPDWFLDAFQDIKHTQTI